MAEGTSDKVTAGPATRPIIVARDIEQGREMAAVKGLNPFSREVIYLTPGHMNGVRGIRGSWDDVIWGLHWAELSVRDWEQLAPAMLGGTPPQAE
jgi:hypothetical protein